MNMINHDLVTHETKRHSLYKFFIIVALFVGYFLFIASHYGLRDGFGVSVLTWSFFVLCTPIADAGFVLDFPLRVLTKIRMIYAEGLVWMLAIGVNIYSYFRTPEIYEKTKILSLFKHILDQPVPFWSLIIISGIGTFLSVQIGDELMDKIHHKDRILPTKHHHNYRMILFVAILLMTFILYDYLLKQLGVDVPL